MFVLDVYLSIIVDEIERYNDVSMVGDAYKILVFTQRHCIVTKIIFMKY